MPAAEPTTPRPRLASLVALSLLVVPLAGCLDSGPGSSAAQGPEPTGAWANGTGPVQVATLGDPDASGLPDWPGVFDTKPTVHDLDGDGDGEVLAHNNDRGIYVFDPASGQALATLETSFPPSWHSERVLNRVAVAALGPGQAPSIVAANPAAVVTLWTVDPANTTADDLAVEKRFETRTDECGASPSMDGGPELTDLDGDDELEILVQTEEVGLFALEPDGSVLWHHCWAGGNSAPVSGDVDGDGRPEAVFASDSGLVAAFDGATGDPLWTFKATDHGIQPGSVTQAPTIADLDGAPPAEVLFTARDASVTDPDRYDENHMAIFALRQNLTTGKVELAWARQPSWANPLSQTRLVVEDVDDDGQADVFGMDWNTIGHRPGDWERLGPANVFRLDATGEDVWVRQVDTWWSNHDVAVADLDADNETEVLTTGSGDGGDGVWMLSATTGAAEAFLPVDPWKMSRGPHLVDPGDDAPAQLLAPVEADGDTLDRGAILVYDLGPAANATPAGS